MFGGNSTHRKGDNFVSESPERIVHFYRLQSSAKWHRVNYNKLDRLDLRLIDDVSPGIGRILFLVIFIWDEKS